MSSQLWYSHQFSNVVISCHFLGLLASLILPIWDLSLILSPGAPKGVTGITGLVMGSQVGRTMECWHIQFSRSVVSDSLQPRESQHARPPCPSPTPGVYSNSHPSSRWCLPAISFSVIPFSSCPQPLPASGSFPMSQLFTWGGQSIGISASVSVLPRNTQDSSPLGWTGWISLQSKGLSRVFSNTTVQKHQFFGAQLSPQSNSHIHKWLLEKPEPWLDGPLLAK